MHNLTHNNKMKAWFFNKDLSPSTLELIDYGIPILKTGQALIKVAFAAINHRDIWISKKQYPNLTNCILGSDCYGKVVQVEGTDTNDWIGKNVIVNPSINYPYNSDSNTKEEFQILGMPTNGTFAQYLAVNLEQLVLAPQHHIPFSRFNYTFEL